MAMACFAGWLLAGCSSTDNEPEEPVAPPTQEETQITLEKFGDIKLYPGNQRIKVVYKYSDTRAKKCEIQWTVSAEKQTKEVAITPTQGDAYNEFFLDVADEGTYSFVFIAYTEDKKGESPKWVSSPTAVYGKKYIESLKNPGITVVSYNEETHQLAFKWSEELKDVVRYLLSYTGTDAAAKEVKVEAAAGENITLEDFPANGTLTCATVYCPKNAIDEFTAKATQIQVNTDKEERWALKMEMTAPTTLTTDWKTVDTHMRKYKFEYTEHSNNASPGTDHDSESHIAVVNDATLGQTVYRFDLHAEANADGTIKVLDGDRGSKVDRMRNEMKSRTGNGNHDMNGNWEEWQRLEWKFKIPKGFRPTTSFTHIHQLKAQEGNNGSPVITISLRASDANGKNSRVQVIHTGDVSSTNKGTIIDNLPLSDFEDQWIQVTTEMYYTHNGSFYIKMERISDKKVLVEKQFTDIDLWRKGAIDIRNKFGIYRSYGGKLDEKYNGKFPTNGIKSESLYLTDFKVYEKQSKTNPTAHD